MSPNEWNAGPRGRVLMAARSATVPKRREALATVCLLLSAGPGVLSAQVFDISGVWESYHVGGNPRVTRHRVLDLQSDGTFVLSHLTSDPESPFWEETGTYTLQGPMVELSNELRLESLQDSLLLEEGASQSRFSRGHRVDERLMLGRWSLIGPDGQPTGSEISLSPDGTYHAVLDNGEEWGPFHVRGSGMVHWPTRATNDLLGVPGVWTSINASPGKFSYEILNGVVITASYLGPVLATSVRAASWAKIKLPERTSQSLPAD